MTIHKYYNPVKIVFGIDSFNEIGNYIERYCENKRVLVVTDKSLLKILGIQDYLTDLIQKKEYIIDIFEKDSIFTSLDVIDQGTKLVNDNHYGLIVGIGGGSAMDCAKTIAILGNNRGNIREYLYEKKKIINEGIPLIEVPTTSGTGSEVTKWATLWDMGEKKKKISLSNEKMFAKVAVVDPKLTLTLSQQMTAITGFDALIQAIEAFWSRNHNYFSDLLALEAIRIIFNNILKAYQNPKEIRFRKNMALGSLKSGLAFSNTKTTAIHSVSYPITLHFNVQHGLACALTLGQFMIYNSKPTTDNIKEAPERIKEINKIIGAENPVHSSEIFSNLMKKMNLPTQLHELGIDKNGINLIIKEGFTPDRVKHNPRNLTKENLRIILNKIM